MLSVNKIQNISNEVSAEVIRSISLHGDMKSTHEGYGVIKEEFDELWDLIKQTKHWDRDPEARSKMRHEAIQIAAMAVKFIANICEV